MFGFLSLFKKTDEKAIDEDEYDFKEMPVPETEIKGLVENPMGSVNKTAEKQQHVRPTPTKDRAAQIKADQADIEIIREEFRSILAASELPSEEVNSPHTNTHEDFHKTGHITKEEFDNLPRLARFNFSFENRDGARTASIVINGENVQIAAEFPRDAREIVPPESLPYFSIQ